MANVTPFLMFEGQANEAMQFYTQLFQPAGILNAVHYGQDSPQAGQVQLARFQVKGQEIMCIDSGLHHEFTFTPAFSLYVNCGSLDELKTLYAALSEGGGVLMPLGDYGFSQQFSWVNDRYGVSWQLNLP